MSSRQAARRAEISQLSKKLATTNGQDTSDLLQRFDALVAEASAVDRIASPQQAVASLQIALYAMGADPRHPLPEERLIQLAAHFLKTLVGLMAIQEALLTPCIGGLGLVISRMTGIA